MLDPDSNEARLARHRDLFRTVPKEVSEAAKEEARKLLDDILGATLELTAGLEYVQRICTTQTAYVSYETLQRSGFRRKDGWQRRYTLADARNHASTAEIRLRNAWELLDPVSRAGLEGARRTALGNSQAALQIAIDHLQAVLNRPKTTNERIAAEAAARVWLESIGSAPS